MQTVEYTLYKGTEDEVILDLHYYNNTDDEDLPDLVVLDYATTQDGEDFALTDEEYNTLNAWLNTRAKELVGEDRYYSRLASHEYDD